MTKLMIAKLFLSLFLSIFFYCIQANPIIVCGKADKKTKNYIFIKTHPFQESKMQNIDSSGYFHFSLQSTNKGIFITVANSEILVQTNDSLYVEIENDSIISISGSNCNLNKELIALQKNQAKFPDKNLMYVKYIDFIKGIKDWYQISINNILESTKQKSISKHEKQLLLSYIKIAYTKQLYLYQYIHASIDDKEQLYIAQTSGEIYEILKSVDFNDSTIVTSHEYSSCQYFFIKYKLATQYNSKKSYLMNVLDKIHELKLSNLNHDIAFSNMSLFWSIAYNKESFFRDCDSIIQYFNENAFDKHNAMLLNQQFQKEFNFLRPEKIMTNVLLYDTNNISIPLTNFENKVIYIKLWNLGCKGCIDEIPAFNQLINNLNDTNIVYISVLVENRNNDAQWNDKILKWKKTIKKLQFQGIHLISPYGNGSGIDKYCESRISGYVILNKGNKIVNLNAPHPQIPETKAILKDVIQKNIK